MHKCIRLFFLFLLLFLVACAGSEESTIEEAPAADVESEEEAAEELAAEPPSAIESEDDSGALPPPINSGSKVTATEQANGNTAALFFPFLPFQVTSHVSHQTFAMATGHGFHFVQQTTTFYSIGLLVSYLHHL